MLDHITPVILTFNEEPNIRATLSRLAWAREIVVVDSGSTDRTVEILNSYPAVRVFHRPFDTHAGQWRFATSETGISTPWLLRLDADYILTPELIAELALLDSDAPLDAYRIGFQYAVFSRTLRSTLYPANTILLRTGKFTVWDNGHTESWKVNGPTGNLSGKIVHDDRKPLDRWFLSQARYARLELTAMSGRRGGLEDWLRRHPPLMPIAVFFYCFFVKGLLFDGKAGLYYALQRTMAEMYLALTALDDALRKRR